MNLEKVDKILKISISIEELNKYMKDLENAIAQLTESEYKENLELLYSKFENIINNARDF